MELKQVCSCRLDVNIFDISVYILFFGLQLKVPGHKQDYKIPGVSFCLSVCMFLAFLKQSCINVDEVWEVIIWITDFGVA